MLLLLTLRFSINCVFLSLGELPMDLVKLFPILNHWFSPTITSKNWVIWIPWLNLQNWHLWVFSVIQLLTSSTIASMLSTKSQVLEYWISARSNKRYELTFLNIFSHLTFSTKNLLNLSRRKMKLASCLNRKRARNLPKSSDKRRKIWVLTSPKHRSVMNPYCQLFIYIQ